MSRKRWIIIVVVLVLVAGLAGGAYASRGVAQELLTSYELGQIMPVCERQDFMACRDQVQQFVTDHPNHAIAWTILGNTYNDLDDDVQAEAAYKQALAADPQTFQAQTGLGIVYRKRGDLQRAREAYERALAINPDYAQAYSSIAVIEIEREAYADALAPAEKAYELDKEDPTVAANLAVVYHYNAMYPQRDQAFTQATMLGYDKLDQLQEIFSR